MSHLFRDFTENRNFLLLISILTIFRNIIFLLLLLIFYVIVVRQVDGIPGNSKQQVETLKSETKIIFQSFLYSHAAGFLRGGGAIKALPFLLYMGMYVVPTHR